ncbi:chromatin remodelling complex Rsc7/Swp82 subunit-domain-containing protein [Mycena galericulata]|nr:chromatin remodelling complex Rsc7/Swp82 subunit-domain-containing protein [Mycena galericulata]
MSSVPKIIIKPRLSVPSRSVPPSPEGEEEGDRDADADAEDEPDDAPTPMDVDADVASVSEESGAPSVIIVKRGRGRPRGRGRSVPTSGTSTPRGRGRGRGTRAAKPRGGTGRTILGSGALTIRLPKRPEEDEEEEELAEGEAGTEGEVVEEKEKEPVAPLGGGKPFRKILGKAYVIEGDEFVTEDDPKGDEKIDKWGNLLGGRRFKASTFILPGRHPERRYMLAIDAARTSGFRDSLYYFRRNPLAFKQNATQPEKDYLISQGKLGPHLRTRSVTLITARSAFKLHGSKMIIDGKWVVDDYYEEKSLEEITARGLKAGDPVGELPDPNALYHSNEPSNLNAAAAANAASKNDRGGGGPMGVYRAGGPTTIFGSSGWGPFSDGPLNAVRKSLLSRDGVSEENWMWMAATRTLAAGEEWARWRKESVQPMDSAGNVVKGKRKADEVDEPQEGTSSSKKSKPDLTDELPRGVYEAHTGSVQYRAETQPTRSRMEVLPDSDLKSVLGGTKVGNGAWAVAWLDTVMEFRTPQEQEKPEVEEKHRLWKEAEASAMALDAT